MRLLSTIAAAFLAFTSTAAEASFKVRKVKTGSYDKIMVSGDFKVRLVPGTEGEIFVEGDRSDIRQLVVSTVGNTLKIYPKKDFRDWTDDMKSVTVVVPIESIDEIVLAGSGEITSETTINADRFKTQLLGNGLIDLALSTNETGVLLTGNGKINLNGNTGKFVSNVEGQGELYAYALQSATTETTVIGSGKAHVNSTENLIAQVAGSGKINYSGLPKIERKTIIGTGLIAARE